MIELHPLIQVILGGLFLGVFIISLARNSGSEDDEDDDRSEKSQQARDQG